MKRVITFIIFIFFIASCGFIKNIRENKIQQRAKENFHIYILLGQSNMSGRGRLDSIDTLPHNRVYMFNSDSIWVLAKDPIHNELTKTVGTGLGLSFGKKMAENNKNTKIGLIPCAIGATSINQWFSDSCHLPSGVYPYDEAINRINLGSKEGTIKGFLWHQGESDCDKLVDVESYEKKFILFKINILNDLSLKESTFVIGELGHFLYDKKPLAKDLNDVLRKIALNDKCIGLVKSDSLNHKGDKIHFDSHSYRILGTRYAHKMIEVQQSFKKKRRFL